MKKPLFTPEELEEMAAADAEIEESFCMTNEDLRRSRELDRRIKRENMPFDKRKIAEAQKAYREANREKINAYHREWDRKRKQKEKESQPVAGSSS